MHNMTTITQIDANRRTPNNRPDAKTPEGKLRASKDIRARYVETAMLDKQLTDDAEAIQQKYDIVDEPRIASAIQSLDKPRASAYVNSQRQESRLYRHYERPICLLADLQQN